MASGHRTYLLTTVVVVIVMTAGWFTYRPALSGTFLLDDVSNLGDLKNVDGRSSALRFVLSGSAGPVGRPIALASFLPQADAWETGAAPFLTVNILIHLLNACLLAGFLYRLTLARGVAVADARYAALAAMAIWLFMPLLASSTLMVVQRMTTLSATFVLLGLNAYLLARSAVERNGTVGLAGMSIALVAATFLAVLTKESGALLPVFVLVIEATLLHQPAGVSLGRWRAWSAVFLLLPAVLIVGYLGTHLPYSESLALRRDYSGGERLLSEARILWEYLLNAFVPRPGHYGPYHDGHPAARSILEPLTFLAVAGWVAAIGSALVWRRKHPLFAFAVLWFVAGHLLESTTIALELYFEHRNYLPVAGPVYALCCSVPAVPQRYRRIAMAGLSLYVFVNVFFLVSLTSLWGNPDLATRYWHERQPDSGRAATAMATRQLGRDGPLATLNTLKQHVSRHPAHAYIGIPALNLSCIIAPDQDHRSYAASVEKLLANVDFSYTAGTMLSQLFTTVSRTDCNGIDGHVVERLARSLLRNPRYASDTAYRQLHEKLMASIARESGDTDRTLDHLRKAIAYQPATELNMMVVTTLVSDSRFDDARDYIEEAREMAPLHPLRCWLWRNDLAELRTYIDESEKVAMGRPASKSVSEAGGRMR